MGSVFRLLACRCWVSCYPGSRTLLAWRLSSFPPSHQTLTASGRCSGQRPCPFPSNRLEMGLRYSPIGSMFSRQWRGWSSTRDACARCRRPETPAWTVRSTLSSFHSPKSADGSRSACSVREPDRMGFWVSPPSPQPEESRSSLIRVPMHPACLWAPGDWDSSISSYRRTTWALSWARSPAMGWQRGLGRERISPVQALIHQVGKSLRPWRLTAMRSYMPSYSRRCRPA